jgi:SAM-dependent methyltransferase
MNEYRHFARVYDVLGDTFLPVILRQVDRGLENHPPPGRRLLDMGCGTGGFAVEMAARGLDVVGVDHSEEMLARARERAERRGVEVEWVRDDMRRFERPGAFDVATCLYDTLNHLTTNIDLMAAVRRVRASLAGGGVFLFDTNNRLAYWNIWDDPDPFEVDGDGFHLTIRTRFDRDARSGDGTVRIEQDGRTYEEEIRQRFFSDREVRGALMAERLEELSRWDFDPFPPKNTGHYGTRGLWRDHPEPDKVKTLWVARRSGRASDGA